MKHVPMHRFNKGEKVNDYGPKREAVYCGPWAAFETSRGTGVLYDEESKDCQHFKSFMEARAALVKLTQEQW